MSYFFLIIETEKDIMQMCLCVPMKLFYLYYFVLKNVYIKAIKNVSDFYSLPLYSPFKLICYFANLFLKIIFPSY